MGGSDILTSYGEATVELHTVREKVKNVPLSSQVPLPIRSYVIRQIIGFEKQMSELNQTPQEDVNRDPKQLDDTRRLTRLYKVYDALTGESPKYRVLIDYFITRLREIGEVQELHPDLLEKEIEKEKADIQNFLQQILNR